MIAFRKPESKKEASFTFDYQKWYSKALPVVRRLAGDRYDEFKHYYEPDPKRKSLGYGTYVIHDCRRRSNIDPPCRSNIDPGMDADRMTVGCG